MTSVVITGMGLVSPLGCGVDRVWARLLEGRSGIRRLPDTVVEDVPCKVGGVVPTIAEDPEGGFDLDATVSPREQKRMDRFIHFALGAAEEALAAADWKPTEMADLERTGVIIASGVGGFPAMVEATRITDSKGPRRLSPFTVPAFLVNLAAGQISIRYGFKGPLGAPVTACAASVQAIGDAARLIRAGEADVVVAGGAEACIDRVSLGAFAAARALSTNFNDTPQRASRPYDRDRDGFVMGEGAAVLVLESEAHARARGAKILAEVVGYGTSADAYQMTAGPADGEGAIRAMQVALAQAGISAGEVDHINAHATSTPVGDAGELAAIHTLFGEGRPPISATKGATGHLLGAAGALEAVFTVMALRTSLLPPTLNLDHPDAAAEGLDLVAGEPCRQAIRHALSNGFGFGGVNASVVLRRHDEP